MFAAAACAVLAALTLAVVRTLKGPTAFDRALAGNTIGTLATLLRAVIGFLSGRPRVARHRHRLWIAERDRDAGDAQVLLSWRSRIRRGGGGDIAN